MRKSILSALFIIVIFSTIVFSIAYIRVTYPNGGEEVSGTIDVEANYGAESNTSEQVESVEFYYIKGEDEIYIDTYICKDGESGTATVNWDTTQVENDSDYKIKAIAKSDSKLDKSDTSDDFFTVDNRPHFDLGLVEFFTPSNTYIIFWGKPAIVPLLHIISGEGEVDEVDYHIKGEVYRGSRLYKTYEKPIQTIHNGEHQGQHHRLSISKQGYYTVFVNAVLDDDSVKDRNPENNQKIVTFRVVKIG